MRLFIICGLLAVLSNPAFTQEYKLRQASNTDCWGYAPCAIKWYGECKNSRMSGKGTLHLYTPKDGVQKAVGTFYDGRYDGFVTHYWSNGNKALEGNFQMDKKHGNIKEFYENGQFKFDGTYEYDLKHGYGREYSESGKLLTDGYWVNGKLDRTRNEQVKKFYSKTEIVNQPSINGFVKNHSLKIRMYSNMTGLETYTGELKNGQPNGDGISYQSGNLMYRGYWKDGYYHGSGAEYYHSSSEFDRRIGQWNNGEKYGIFTLYSKNGKEQDQDFGSATTSTTYSSNNSTNQSIKSSQGASTSSVQSRNEDVVIDPNGYVENFKYNQPYRETYTGYIRDGKPHGFGIEYTGFGKKNYEGNWQNGKYQGKGKKYNSESGKLIYDGEHANGNRHGYGIGYMVDGRICSGLFDNHNLIKGSMSFPDGYKFDGEWVRSDPKYGTQSWPSGDKYVGYMQGHSRNGYGTYYKNGKKFYEGQWANNEYHGTGKMYNEDGTLYWEGVANNGDLSNGRYASKPKSNSVFTWENVKKVADVLYENRETIKEGYDWYMENKAEREEKERKEKAAKIDQ